MGRVGCGVGVQQVDSIKRMRESVSRNLQLTHAIVKHVISRYDSNLEIKSKLRQGAEFVCAFPLTKI